MPYTYHYDPNQPRVPLGHPDGGQWTRDGLSPLQPVFFDPRRHVIQKAIEAALAWYTWLSLSNKPGNQAVISFKAREYRRSKVNALEFEYVGQLNEQQLRDVCRRFEDVQDLTDAAAKAIAPMRPYLTAAAYGTKVHVHLKNEIDKLTLRDPNLRAEVALVKGAEADKRYGVKGSKRVDVLEVAKEETLCVYDIKTGESGLSPARIVEISGYTFGAYRKVQRVVLTEVRPR